MYTQAPTWQLFKISKNIHIQLLLNIKIDKNTHTQKERKMRNKKYEEKPHQSCTYK